MFDYASVSVSPLFLDVLNVLHKCPASPAAELGLSGISPIAEMWIPKWCPSHKRNVASYYYFPPCSLQPDAVDSYQYPKVMVSLIFRSCSGDGRDGLAQFGQWLLLPFSSRQHEKKLSQKFFQIFSTSAASKNVSLYLQHPEALHSHTSPHSASNNFWKHFHYVLSHFT